MDRKFLMRLAVVAAVFSMAAAPAVRADDDCQATVVAEGTPASLRDLGAYPNSLLAWRSAVKEKFGSEYNSWRYAKDRDVKCDQGKDGQWVCKRTAKPCKDVLHRLLDGTKEKVKEVAKKDCKSESLQSYGAKKKDEKEGMEEAESGWEIDVRNKYGKEWAVWGNATETDNDCNKVGGGYQCIAVGRPCLGK